LEEEVSRTNLKTVLGRGGFKNKLKTVLGRGGFKNKAQNCPWKRRFQEQNSKLSLEEEVSITNSKLSLEEEVSRTKLKTVLGIGGFKNKTQNCPWKRKYEEHISAIETDQGMPERLDLHET